MPPLSAKLESWQTRLLEDSAAVAAIVERHGSPVNLIEPGTMARNAEKLQAIAERFDTSLKILFARKANKALSLVDEARRLGLGIDLASEVELSQVLDRGITGEHLMMTAAVKPAALIALCLESGTTIAIDNDDEFALTADLAEAHGARGKIALRLAPDLGPGATETRFGFTAEDALAAARRAPGSAAITGVHFHLDGYSATDRVTAIAQSIELVDALREIGHRIQFVDIGGGIPMSYLESEAQWREFWIEHERALAGKRGEVTFENHPLRNVYPYHQAPVLGEWFEQILSARIAGATTVAAALRDRDLQLRCEPGRSLLGGCGITLARVEFRKQRRDGTWLIGLAMNRTQCRSTSDDHLVDPLLVKTAAGEEPEIEGYLVGAYCIERELLSLRRLRFPDGVAVGDLIAFPNTAGYLMHILESSSHQMPLARNVVVGPAGATAIDDIDAKPPTA